MENIYDKIKFERRIIKPNTNYGWIDLYIPETKIIIEQKSYDVDLSAPQPQHENLTPYEQAKMYNDNLPVSKKAYWIITCNFNEFWIYNMDSDYPEPNKIYLDEIPTKYSYFDFIVDNKQKSISREEAISLKAGDFVGLIYDALLEQYNDPSSEHSLKSLNMLCVRAN